MSIYGLCFVGIFWLIIILYFKSRMKKGNRFLDIVAERISGPAIDLRDGKIIEYAFKPTLVKGFLKFSIWFVIIFIVTMLAVAGIIDIFGLGF